MSRSRRGFTLIELLVVIGIIVLLIAISMPIVGKAWELANQAKCKSNLKALAAGMLAFAKEHDGHLPGARLSFWSDRDQDHWDWLYGQYSVSDQPESGGTMTWQQRLECAPQYGTLWKYVSDSKDTANPSPTALKLFLCPSLRYQQAGSGVGSNGRVDYFYFSVWTGANLKDIKANSQLHFPADPTSNIPQVQIADGTAPNSTYGYSSYTEDHPTPLIAQEDARIWSNTQDNSSFAWWNDYSREMTHMHNGGSFYAAVDGSVQFVVEPDTNQGTIYWEGAHLWYQNGPISGRPVTLGQDPGANGSDHDPNPSNSDGLYWGYWAHN